MHPPGRAFYGIEALVRRGRIMYNKFEIRAMWYEEAGDECEGGVLHAWLQGESE